MKSDLGRSQLDLLLLAVLSDGPGHGYTIIEQVRERSSGALDLAEGTVYPALHRLEAEHLVDSEWVQVNSRRRRVYRLTSKGARRLGTSEAEWRQFVLAIQGVLGDRGTGEVPA